MPDATPTQRLQDAEARLRGADQVLAAAPTQVDTDRSWITIAGETESMIKTILVPIVTLVLGYYFGQSSKG